MTNEEVIEILDILSAEYYPNALEKEALDMAIKALEQQPCDCISREKVFEQISCWVNSGEYRYTNATYYLTKRIQGISSVTPQPKIGHWIGEESLDGSIRYMCDNCKEFECVNYYDYCPNCGAKMEVEE